MSFFQFIFRTTRKINTIVKSVINAFITNLILKGNGVEHTTFRTTGIPFIVVARGGYMKLGTDFAMNNGAKGNPIGCYERCTFCVDKGAVLEIGDHVGVSQAAFVSTCSLRIGNYVKIGGGTCVYTTDFHSLDANQRRGMEDRKSRKNAPVIIEDNVFIGAKCIILKGVTIGENSIVGAGSLVTKSIPSNEIWAGNPARFIRKI